MHQTPVSSRLLRNDPGTTFGQGQEPCVLELPIDRESRVALVGPAVGFYGDGWVRPRATFRCRTFARISAILLEVWAPAGPSPLPIALVLDSRETLLLATREQNSTLRYAVEIAAGSEIGIGLRTRQGQRLSGTDPRLAAFILKAITFE